MINLLKKHLHEYRDQGASIMKLPAAAKIQLDGDPQVWVTPRRNDVRVLRPWADECNRQVQEMGPRALGHTIDYTSHTKEHVAVTNKRILEAVSDLRELVAHNVPPIHFEARRRPNRIIERGIVEHSMDD